MVKNAVILKSRNTQRCIQSKDITGCKQPLYKINSRLDVQIKRGKNDSRQRGGRKEKVMKKTVLKLAAKAAYATAKKAGNSASIYGMYQPKEPKTLKKSK